MTTRVVQPERIRKLNDLPPRAGDYVLYWMQQSQRAEDNHALEHAVQRANALRQPLLVVFALTDDYPEASLRHYRFMLEGLQETQRCLAARGIKMVVRLGSPERVAAELAARACVVVCDRGYLRHQRSWRAHLAARAGCECVQVESDVVVPVEVASDKREFAARTIRPKLARHHDEFLIALRKTSLECDSSALAIDGFDISDLDTALGALRIDGSIPAVSALFRGGTSIAKSAIREFIADKLERYDANRRRPGTDDLSHMSMYLHFGQISPLYVALQIRDASQGTSADRESYLEELLVRRELAQNFVQFTDGYDSYECVPDWARATLHAHRADAREHRYTSGELEAGKTHDEYWNAAMREMRHTGFMHNYMRMYWGKKIIEWTDTPEQAYELVLKLNNKYFLDGRDANSYANVAWLFGCHDRPFAERPIFGTVRYLSAKGLERKAKPDAYIAKVDALIEKT